MKIIVLVDDNAINLTLLQCLVKQIEGYLAIAFTKPENALKWCLENEYELIIVDYMMLRMDGIKFITALRASYKKIDAPILMVTANDQANVRYQALKVGATDFLNKPIDKIEFMIRVQNMLKLYDRQHRLMYEREGEIVYRLSKAAEHRDPETGNHIRRVAWYSKHIAIQLGLSLSEQTLIFQASPMHDIGKVGIPDAILLKSGKLEVEEFQIMKNHVLIGHNILNNSSSELLQMGAIIALTHHEKYDGTGYPYGLQGEEISIYGRISAVADVFDALISSRPYKKAWTMERAISFLKENSCTHFDPVCVNAFFKNWDKVLEIRSNFDDKLDNN